MGDLDGTAAPLPTKRSNRQQSYSAKRGSTTHSKPAAQQRAKHNTPTGSYTVKRKRNHWEEQQEDTGRGKP